MSWRSGQCECGNTVDYGIYYSDYEDDLSEIDVTVLCGECVRERDGIPSEEILDAEFEVFKSEVEKHGLRDAINWDVAEGPNRKILEMVCIMYESDEDNSETYASSAWSILTT
ncbi:MAG: hypothetical protein GOVbin4206_45 [Prokaryotic dsDNA virus sp.]|nr:MAG: hypothetical protein GOVbin4206_45 [Prokaryotic dsDNA virus sp.]|tara:strand:+ start:209 stop:547 length:339 start_codon:yes stop_codon:yes gene_type:complete